MKQEAQNPCEGCEQKELCPVYMGQNCLLTIEHKESEEKWNGQANT